jgi:hypothetical protein
MTRKVYEKFSGSPFPAIRGIVRSKLSTIYPHLNNNGENPEGFEIQRPDPELSFYFTFTFFFKMTNVKFWNSLG